MSLIIKTEVDSAYTLRGEFKKYGRENQFSTDGYHALVDYFDSLDEEVELDVIALCCGFSETTINTFINDYRLQPFDNDNPDSTISMVEDFIQNRGGWYQIIDHESRIVYQCF